MRVTTPAPRDAWSELLQSAPTAFVYQTPRGLDALCYERGVKDVSRLYEFEDGRKVVLPLHRDSVLPGPLASETTPRIGSLVSAGPVRPEELRAIYEDLAARRVLRLSLYPGALGGVDWEAVIPEGVTRSSHLAHVLDLEGGFDAIWKERFNSQARRNVRKAEKAELEIEMATGATLLPEFYTLYRSSLQRWSDNRNESRVVAYLKSIRAPSKARLERRLGMLGPMARIWVARSRGQAAAAIIVLQDVNAHYTMGAIDLELGGPTRASFLLQRLAIEDACQSGCRYYNMGETGPSESLARFKTQFGAEPYAYAGYRLEKLPVATVARRFRRRLEGGRSDDPIGDGDRPAEERETAGQA